MPKPILRNLILAGILTAALHASWGQDSATVPGITRQPPATGRSVEAAEGQFMIPYEGSIPGSQVRFTMVPVPGGVFQWGSPDSEKGRGDDEGPQIAVRVEPFWIGATEVTWSQYRHFMQLYDLFKEFKRQRVRSVDDSNRADAVTAPTPLYDPTFTFALGEGDEYPAVTMSPYAARQFTKWLSLASNQFYRLPSEAEWEYACRAGSTTAYSFGNDAEDLDRYAWYFDNANDAYHRVAEKQPNAWGIHDMHGNVAEIVLDQYEPDAYAQAARRADPPVAASSLIRWPTRSMERVIRGGSWNDDAPALRSAARRFTEDWRSEDPNFPKSPWWFTDEEALMVGFRIVRPYQAPAQADQLRYWDEEPAQVLGDVQNRLDEGRGVLGLVTPPGDEESGEK